MKYCACDNQSLAWKSKALDKIEQLNKSAVEKYFFKILLYIEGMGNGRFVCDSCRKTARISDLSLSNKMIYFCSKLPALAFFSILVKGLIFRIYPDHIGPAIDGAAFVVVSMYFFKSLRDEYDYPEPPQKE